MLTKRNHKLLRKCKYKVINNTITAHGFFHHDLSQVLIITNEINVYFAIKRKVIFLKLLAVQILKVIHS